MGSNIEGLAVGLGKVPAVHTNLLVRKVLFLSVYYNNGNSLPGFSIPICREHLSQLGRHERFFSFFLLVKAANQTIDSIFWRGRRMCTALAQCRAFLLQPGEPRASFRCFSLSIYKALQFAAAW
jgi:hypothetical protein